MALPWQQIVDFVVLAIALYVLLNWARRARALRLALAVVLLHLVATFARRQDLIITSAIFNIVAVLVAVLILLIFQSELRRALMSIDGLFQRNLRRPKNATYHTLAEGVFELAKGWVGALIVLPRKDALNELVAASTPLGAVVSRELLVAIFEKHSPLHDGAAILERNEIVSVNAVLPLTGRLDLPVQFGTRHRCALGLTENCDALVVVVSEERGEVRVVNAGIMQQISTPDELVDYLQAAFAPEITSSHPRALVRMALSNFWLKLMAIGMAASLWTMTFFASDAVVRTVFVPLEFRNIAPGLELGEQSVSRLDVEIRGNAWQVDAITPGSLVAQLDLSTCGEGLCTIHTRSGMLNLSPGVSAERIAPGTITIRLERPRK